MRAVLGISLATIGAVLGLHVGAAIHTVQSAGPEAPAIGPQPTMFRAPCDAISQALLRCLPGWVDAKTYDNLRGGDDI